MDFIKSNRGNNILVHDNFLYNKQKTLSNDVISWECINRRNKKSCMARVKTLDNEVVGTMNEHTHPPQPDEIRVMKVRAGMKQRARETTERTRNIISHGISNEDDDVLANFPSFRTMQRDIQRNRHSAQEHVPIPANNDFQFAIPHQYTITSTGEPFLQIDNQFGGRFLMFGSRRSIDFLRDSPDWYVDGTFDTVPAQFMQLYTVHGLQNGRNAIGLYALLRNKNQITYEEMFNHVHSLTGGATPNTINFDFEMAAINAAELIYPNSSLNGCLFHLSQNVYKKIQQNGLVPIYKGNTTFRNHIKMISALAFVPTQDIISSFDELSLNCGVDETPILDYFETNYIGEVRRGQRRNPLFAHSFWSVYNRVNLQLPRTNNALEGWHNAFSCSLGQSHANIWTFIDALKKEHSMVHMAISHHQSGMLPPPRKRKYIAIDNRLNVIVADYNNRQRLAYLRGISYNLKA